MPPGEELQRLPPSTCPYSIVPRGTTSEACGDSRYLTKGDEVDKSLHRLALADGLICGAIA